MGNWYVRMSGIVRVFTTEEAEELLPTVDILLQKLVDTSVKQKLLEEQANEILDEVMEEGTHPNAIDELKEIKGTLDINVREMDKLEGEITNMGLNVKDSILGIVDFPAMRGEQPVYLCHRLGEKKMTHWHNVEDGFEGRNPLDKEPDIITI